MLRRLTRAAARVVGLVAIALRGDVEDLRRLDRHIGGTP